MNIIESIILATLALLERRPDYAARLRGALGINAGPDDGWIPLSRAPMARKTVRRLARTGAIAARQVGGRWYVSQASLDAYMREQGPEAAGNDDETQLRAELGLRRVS